PAPFGPIRPSISPRSIVNDTPSSATTPPNRTSTSRTETSGAAARPIRGSSAATVETADTVKDRPASNRGTGRRGVASLAYPLAFPLLVLVLIVLFFSVLFLIAFFCIVLFLLFLVTRDLSGRRGRPRRCAPG